MTTPPPDFWHDSIWQFIGVVVSIILGIGSYILWFVAFRKQRNRKEVTYEVISDTPVLRIGKEVAGKVEIHFGAKLVADLRLVVLRVWNSGDVPLAPNDFIEPLCFEFGGISEVLETDVLETTPSNMKASLVQDQKTVTVEPLLLNANDSIQLKVLLTGTGEITANARIVGLQQIVRLNRIDDAHRTAYLEKVQQRKLLLQKRRFASYIFSWFLDLLTGYGYKPNRTISIYLIVVLGFAIAYYLIGQLTVADAVVYSLTAFHGRGFFPSTHRSLHDPIILLGAEEAVLGLLIEISFIATFVQRFFTPLKEE